MQSVARVDRDDGQAADTKSQKDAGSQPQTQNLPAGRSISVGEVMKVRLFRGIAIEKADKAVVEASIRAGDLRTGGMDWRLWFRRHPKPLEIASRPGFSRADTRIENLERDGPAASFACGDPEGASHYAWRASRNGSTKLPLLIEFEIDSEQVAVDGRDSLYSLFPKAINSAELRNVVETLWGSGISPYLNLAQGKPRDSDYQFALVDLACTDPDIIHAHYRNPFPIEGRYETKFCSAFVVPRTLHPAAVVDIRVVDSAPRFDEGAGVVNVYRVYGGH